MPPDMPPSAPAAAAPEHAEVLLPGQGAVPIKIDPAEGSLLGAHALDLLRHGKVNFGVGINKDTKLASRDHVVAIFIGRFKIRAHLLQSPQKLLALGIQSG